MKTWSVGEVLRSVDLNANFDSCVSTSDPKTITAAHTWSATQAFQAATFGGAVSANAGLTVASGQTVTVTGATVTGLTAASVGTGTFPGVYTVTGAVTLSAALTYGGVTLTNAVTGTGKMVLSASPTFTGTLIAAIGSFSGAVETAALTATSGTFSQNISATFASITGLQPGGLGASRAVFDFTAGAARWFSLGANGATNGTFSITSQRSDGSNSLVVLSSDVSGNVTFIGSVIAPAATTSIPSLRLPHGSAPSSPTNGDMWTTTSGLFVRINGSTVGPLT